MNKRIGAVLAALGLMLAGLVGVAQPASAASTGSSCIDTDRGVRTCVTITWTTGDMTVTSISHTTPSGCSNLESSGGRYLSWAASNFNYYWGGTPCTWSAGIYEGSPAGTTTKGFHVEYKARINNGPDMRLHWFFALRKNGTFSVEKSETCWVGPNCGGD